MKKFVSVITGLAVLASMTAMLSACGEQPAGTTPSTTPPTTAHTHSYGTEWKSDSSNHWNVCECGEKSNQAAHADADVNGKCDVCNANVPLPAHEHSFGTEWVSDATNHWNACECGETSNVAAHVDTDMNEKCDTCNADVAHEHDFGTNWVTDNVNHWNECACGEKSNEAAHADTDLNEACDTCGHFVELPHTHSFGAGWLSDENNHWHECECGEQSASAAHANTDNDGLCDVCMFIMEEIVEGPADLVMGETAIAKEDATYSFTAGEAGNLTLKYAASAFAIKDYMRVSYTVNDGTPVSLTVNTDTVIALQANDVVIVTIETNCTGTLTASFEVPVATTPVQMGTNAIPAQDTVFSYTATENGNLTLTMAMASSYTSPRDFLEGTYSINNGEAVSLVKGTATAIALNEGDTIVISISTNTASTLTAAWEAAYQKLLSFLK